MTDNKAAITWSCTTLDDSSLAAFEIRSPDGVLDHSRLAEVSLPAELRGRERNGLILSGRGPIWLYAHLVHLAHPFAWVAVHDPRLGGAVVVTRHVPTSPPLGSIVPVF